MERYRRKFLVAGLCCSCVFFTACAKAQSETGALPATEIAEVTEDGKIENMETERSESVVLQTEDVEKETEKEQETEVQKELTEEEKLEIKYKLFHYENYVQGEDTSGWTEQDYKMERQIVEDILEREFYQVWQQKNEDMAEGNMQFKIDAFAIDERDYGLLWYDWVSEEPSFGYYFLDSPEETYTAKITHIPAFYEIEVYDMFELYLESSQSYFVNYTNEKLAECNEKLDEYYRQRASGFTKEEVYAVAQQDLKDRINSQMNWSERMIFAASRTWTFDPVENISYVYDPASRMHSLQFTVRILEYMGVGESICKTVSMQYLEDENGALSFFSMDVIG